eukprot:16435100-Heterocapsa_arctica.AAC.1
MELCGGPVRVSSEKGRSSGVEEPIVFWDGDQGLAVLFSLIPARGGAMNVPTGYEDRPMPEVVPNVRVHVEVSERDFDPIDDLPPGPALQRCPDP